MVEWEFSRDKKSRHRECENCGGILIQTVVRDEWYGKETHDVLDCISYLGELGKSNESRIKLLEDENAGLRDDIRSLQGFGEE